MILKILKRKLDRRRLFKRVFETEDGQEVLGYLLREANITKPSLTRDPNELLIQTGRQQMIYSIIREINQSEEAIIKQIEQQSKNEHQ